MVVTLLAFKGYDEFSHFHLILHVAAGNYFPLVALNPPSSPIWANSDKF